MKSLSAHPLFKRALQLVVLLVPLAAAPAADFTVRTPTPAFFFLINGVTNATLTLVRGRTYTFDVDTICGFHPFRVNSPGVDTSSLCFGLLTYVVPTNAANYFYDCAVHGQS